MSTQPLRFGVNYVPSQNWWYSWVDWDRAAIATDLQAIAALGFDHLRIHCLWPVFQPNANYVSATALDHLEELLDLADASGLDIQVAVLDGWLSGFCFIPAWQLDRNIFTDPVSIAAEELLYTALAARIGKHRRFLGFDLGNELGVLMGKGHPVTPALADLWQTRMLQHCAKVAPGRFHVNGVDHIHWFRNLGFTRPTLATTGAATSLHAWTEFTGFRAAFGAEGLGSVHLTEYSMELARAYHQDPNRLIWLQEFGSSRAWMPEEHIPDFAEKTIRCAASCGNLWGFTWWCSHELKRAFTGFDVCEYDVGLLDVNNRPKPVAQTIAGLIREFRRTPPQVALRRRAVVLRDDAFTADSTAAALKFARIWVSQIADGIGPAIVLASRSQDRAYLAARGIDELLD
ncbi:MAG: glycosyl hydrolase [Phycisphaerae bacterium]